MLAIILSLLHVTEINLLPVCDLPFYFMMSFDKQKFWILLVEFMNFSYILVLSSPTCISKVLSLTFYFIWNFYNGVTQKLFFSLPIWINNFPSSTYGTFSFFSTKLTYCFFYISVSYMCRSIPWLSFSICNMYQFYNNCYIFIILDMW